MSITHRCSGGETCMCVYDPECNPEMKAYNDKLHAEEVDRAAAALYGELAVTTDRLAPGSDEASWDKERLRRAARNILWAASDPMWGKR